MAGAFFTSKLVAGDAKIKFVTSFSVELQVNRPASAWVDVLCDETIDPDKLVGAPAMLSYGYDEEESPHRFSGIIESITSFALPDSGGTLLFNYRIHIVDSLALAAWNEGCAIWLDLAAPDVIKKSLEECGIGSDKVDIRLTATYLKREFCVRYNESVLAFVNRLCEEEGIYYFWDLAGDDVKLVFADDSSNAAPIDGDEDVKYMPPTGMEDAHDAISHIFDRRRVVSGKFTLRDFNLETPKVDLTADAQSDVDTDLEMYDFPGIYGDVAEGKRLAKVRLEAEQVERHLVDLQLDCTRTHAGRLMKISDAQFADVAGEFFIVAVTHSMTRLGGDKTTGSIGDESYATAATVLPAKVKYRAPRITPVPIMEGPQTATVVCPDGAKTEEIETDEFGRGKVKFHWDPKSEQNDKISAWFRVGQIQTSGSMMLPRLGWEVIVEFEEGNPDRPYITGKLNNGAFMPPYALPEGRSRTAIMSHSSPGGDGTNEIRYEDKAGGEEIMIHSHKDTTIKAANNKTKNVGNNESAAVGANRTLQVGSNQDVKVTKASLNTIKGNQSVTVSAVRKVEVNAVTGLTVGGNASTTVGGMHYEMDGNPLEALIALAVAKAAEFAAEKAAEAAEHVKGAVMGKVNQVLGPVQGVVSQAQQLGGGMMALANGDMSGAGALIAGASGLPGASAVAGGLAGKGGGGGASNEGGGGHAEGGEGGGGEGGGGEGGGGGGGGGLKPVQPGLAATTHAGPGGKGASAGGIAAENLVSGMLTDVVQKGIRKGAKALAGGEGGDAAGGGSESGENEAGPKGDVAGVDGEDKDKGPGHNENLVSGSVTETVGSLKVQGTAEGIMLNATILTETIGAARAEIVLGNRAESVEGMKMEQSLGLIVLSKGDETENVGGAKTAMVGGAVVDLVKGGHSVEAATAATFIGAFHKVEAKTKITFKCGASSVVVDDSGITIESPLIMVTASKIELSDKVTEV
jgi:type VI secretion system secreted protein VgrG